MSLDTNLRNLGTRVGTEAKALRTLINGNALDLSALTTAQRSNLVAAINEINAAVKAAASSGGAAIDDASASSGTTYSSQKIDSQIRTAIDALVAGAPGALDTLKELADALATKGDAAAITTTLAAKQDKVDIGPTDTDYVSVFEAALA